MKKQITRISILQTAKVAAAMYFVLSLLMIVCFVIPTMMFSGQMRMPMFVVLVMPLFYVLFGFVFTVIGAWIYNVVASMIGGIEYTTADIDKV
jgi:hypothetical protein